MRGEKNNNENNKTKKKTTMRRTVNVRTEEMQEIVVLSVSPFFGAAERTKVEHSANVSRCVFFFAVCVLCDTC